MQLLTKEIAKKFPALYQTQNKKPEDVKIIAKFFNPCGSWTWFATEACGIKDNKEVSLKKVNWEECQDVRFYGFVDGDFPELGYFMLRELQSIRVFAGLRIERDLYFEDRTLADVMRKANV